MRPPRGLQDRMRRAWTIILGSLTLAAGLVYFFYTAVRPAVIFGLRSDYARPIAYQPTPEGIGSLRAESCGTCHREIYEEWKTSIHAHAFDDPFFQAGWKKRSRSPTPGTIASTSRSQSRAPPVTSGRA